jgi:methylamine---glutamate N-methyltransferase subunit C
MELIYPHSQIWTPETIRDIHARSDGGYMLSGFRPFHETPTFDELVFLASGLTRFPLEGYKERSKTRTTIGSRAPTGPMVIETPVYVASRADLSPESRAALAIGSGLVQTAISVGGRLILEERKAKGLIYEVAMGARAEAPTTRKADALQINVPAGTSVDDLARYIRTVRKKHEYGGPCLVSFSTGRVRDDTRAAVRAGADVIVLSGLESRPAHSIEDSSRFNRMPIIAALSEAREALRESKVLGEVQIIAATGIRNGADAAKGLALGADALAVSESAVIASGYDSRLKMHPDAARPAGRDDVETAAVHVAKFITSMTMEIALLSRSLGKGNVHSLEFEDLASLTTEASKMTGVRLAGE